jgi:hypothetical protein
MDERIIYLIFILLWAAYKFYQKSQKTKNISDKKLSPASKPSAPDYKSIFEKMLLGEEFTAPAKTLDNEEIMENGEWRMENSINQQINKSIIEEKPVELKETIRTEEITKSPNYQITKFNLKQALIYSVILNRPYQ